MAIRQITGTEDVPQLKNQIDDDNGSWWGGVRLAGATTIALAAGLAITALSSQVAQNVANSHQDDPAGSLVNLRVEEDYWQYRLPSKTDYFVAAQYDTPETVTQPTFAPDDDAWQSPAPQAQVIQYAQPWAFAQDETFFFPDEDYWQQPRPNQPVSFAQPIFAQDEVPPVVANAFDEDYWQQPQPAQPATLAQVFSYQDEVVQVVNRFEEDYWQSGVRPVFMTFMTFAQMAPWGWDDVRIQPPASGPPASGRPARLGIGAAILR